ncbi:hypothetical protein HAU06_20600 [Bacillus toyonensis]|uniref:Rho termination factor N-terminal domain-containing protein n=1 Tax=Bacillus toyonensis TaxID=155322 RepID=UPI000BEC003F|nr:Rho termination factor N-terminal domain-containing protein [Bacillus toyonensis]MBC2686478.1 hypothetical protein [Bacillus toyonensis]PDY86319.1 hypothetical protein CON67_25370 [Bacillus toyonensis]
MLKKILEMFNSSKSIKNTSNEQCERVVYSTDKLNNAHLEFLIYIHKKDYTKLPNYWCEYIGDINITLSKLFRMGLIERPNEVQMLDTNTIKTLKNIAKSNGVKGYSKLKKNEIIELLIQNCSKEYIFQLHKNLTIYVLTSHGEKLVNEYQQKKNLQRSQLICQITNCIKENDLIKAAEMVIRHEQKQVLKRGLGIDWKNIEPNQLLGTCNEIVNLTFQDLDNTVEYKKLMKMHLIISELLGEGIDKTSCRFLSETTEEIKCSSLEKFLENPHGGFGSRMSSSNNDKVQLYLHYVLFQASNQRKLNTLLSYKAGDGIEILKTENPEECSICGNVKNIYLWDEVKNIPKLPLHFGCRCLYVGYFKKYNV